jgi:hypothetical protein
VTTRQEWALGIVLFFATLAMMLAPLAIERMLGR